MPVLYSAEMRRTGVGVVAVLVALAAANAASATVSAHVGRGTLTVTGDRRANAITLRLQRGNHGRIQVVVDGHVRFTFARRRFTAIVVNGGRGDDALRIDQGRGAFTDVERTTLSGGAGDDALVGGKGAEKLLGGAGADSVTGNGGVDAAALGTGADAFTWDPGDGNDVVDGNSGFDRLSLHGSAAGETFDVAPNGARLRVTRDLGAVTLDLSRLERVDVAARGGDDRVNVHDLTTAPASVNVDLGTGNDRVTVDGTEGDSTMLLSGNASLLTLTGLAAQLTVAHGAAADGLTLNVLGGADTLDAAAYSGRLPLLVDAGTGSDAVTGGGGADVVLLGPGDDTFAWNPGAGSDTVEGQAGTDTVRVNGSAANEAFTLSANGARLALLRHLDSSLLDANGVERVSLLPAGGADAVIQNDLSGTAVTLLELDFGPADGLVNALTVNGTNGDDVATIAGNASGVTVAGLAAQVHLTHSAPADTLRFNALAGDDVVDASGLSAGALLLTEDGGNGGDVLIGSADADTIFGGAGDDVLIGGPAVDVLDGGPGSNVVIQD